MNVQFHQRPSQTLVELQLAPGDEVRAEPGSMVAMSASIDMKTAAGGLLKGLKRVFGGESFFQNTYVARAASELFLAPKLPGDVMSLPVGVKSYFIQNTGYVASHGGVELNTKLGGIGGFLSGAGLFTLHASGQGTVFVSSFGALREVDISSEYVVDTGHLVAWEDTLTYSITKAGSGWVGSFLSGEGLVCHFRGSGKLWVQTRNPAEYGRSLGAMLPPRRN